MRNCWAPLAASMPMKPKASARTRRLKRWSRPRWKMARPPKMAAVQARERERFLHRHGAGESGDNDGGEAEAAEEIGERRRHRALGTRACGPERSARRER